MLVKVTEIDKQGRVNLSRKAMLNEEDKKQFHRFKIKVFNQAYYYENNFIFSKVVRLFLKSIKEKT